ncbi:class I SAM-dependent methyltransferase [Candidatus Kaiserbacteria bacterium]|nr:class I SAM-dependent methyltransferase [Candidatus Kaiserbacteria bacterium]
MSEGNVGIRSVLKFPSVYDLYQWLVGSRAARDRLFRTYVSFPEGCKLLDIGCGSGELLEYLPSHVRYTGVDVNPLYIELARKKYGNQGRFELIDVNDIESLDLPKNNFDVVVLYGVLHHLNDGEVRGVLSFARMMLKLGGTVFTVDGVYLKDQSRIKKFILSRDRGAFVRFNYQYQKLAREVFPDVETFVERNALRIPTDYFVMRMTK